MNRHPLAVMLVALAFASGALAQGEPRAGSKPVQVKRERSAAAGGSAVPQPTDSLFRELDRNGDGVLTPDELATDQARRSNWIAIDRNRDGRITPGEFRAVSPR